MTKIIYNPKHENIGKHEALTIGKVYEVNRVENLNSFVTINYIKSDLGFLYLVVIPDDDFKIVE